MNFSKSDLPILKWSLLAFTLSLALSVTAVWLSGEYVGASKKDRQAAQRLLNDARKSLAESRSDLENMSAYSSEYTTLEEYKIIGNEQRLDWIEDLAKLRQQNLVVDFKYTISPQVAYTPKPSLEMGNYELKLSGLNLQIEVLHELQLINFLDALRSNVKGWFILDHCSMERTGGTHVSEGPSTKNLNTHLKAECVGGWLTMKKKGSP